MNAILQIISSPPAGSLLYESTYNFLLVALSVLLAVAAAYASLSAATRVERQSEFTMRMAWVGISSLTLGVGIWAMHFVGMLALSLPCGIHYDPVITLLSMLPGILVSSIALGVTWHKESKGLPPIFGSVLLGAGIGTMHYAGMGAMQIAGFVRYEPKLFLLSIVVAVALAYVALLVKQMNTKKSAARMFLVALILGSAVSGMHYTAMAAAYFVPGDATALPASVFSASNLAIMVTSITLLASVATVVLVSFSKMKGMATDLRRAEAELQTYVRKLEADSKIQSYLVEVSADLHQATTLSDFTHKFLQHVTTKIEAEYGAFYILDQDSQRLNPIGWHGALAGDLESMEIGHGLVGQCAKDKLPLVLNDSSETTLRIVWGAAELKPKSVFILPVMQSSHLLGVIVLAAMKPIDADKQSLLQALLPSTATNLELLGRNLGSQRLVWGSQYKVGVQQIDNQHQELVGMFGALSDAVKENRGHEVLGKILDDLINYTVYHFETEEGLMQTYAYPQSPAHRKEHEDLKITVTDLQKKFNEGKATVTFQTVQLLNDWLTHHILKVDKHFAAFLNAKEIK